VLIIEEQPPTGQPPRVETYSCKSRDLASLNERALAAQIMADASDGLDYYGGTLDIRRLSLRHRVQVQRVRLVYERSGLMPQIPNSLKIAVDTVQRDVRGVEVVFQ
jgi:hypothetical protein